MKGMNYIIRLLKGDDPRDVITSMPEEDYNKMADAIHNLGNTNLPRQQRRAIQRKFQKIKR